MKNIYSRDGVAIGSVPDSWAVNKTLRCLKMPITDGPHETPEAVGEEIGIPFVSAEAVSCGKGSIDFDHIWGYISKEYYDECCRKYIPQKDDIYMIKSGATTGKVSIVDTDRIFTIWSPLAVFRADINIVLPRYMYYFLQSPMYLSQVELGWNYGTQQNIGMRMLEKLYICYPNTDEQRNIVCYLDNKCAAINEAIEKHEKIIEKLEEHKRAYIISAVAGKYIDADCKESSIPWMKRIPSSWQELPLKFVFGERKQKNAGMIENNLLSLSYGNIKRKDINTNEGLLPESFEGYNIVGKGDIVLRLTDLQNDKRSLRTGLVKERGIITSAYVTLYPLISVNSEYYRYLLHAYDLRKVFYTMGEGIRQSLKYDDISRNFILPIPSDEEQAKISADIQEIENKTDTAVKRHESIIEKLEEYKKSIIYHAVTGKIDCREVRL